MRNIKKVYFGNGRFRPVSFKFFSTYAKHLSRLTGDGLQRSQNTLARIYGYDHLHELQQILQHPGIPGPFEDEIDFDDFHTEEIQEAIADRNARALQIILEDGYARYENGAPAPTLFQVTVLELFSTPKAHIEAFKRLSIPKTTAEERRQEREKYAAPLDEEEYIEQAYVDQDKEWRIKDAYQDRSVYEELQAYTKPSFEPASPTVVIKHKRRKQIIKPSDEVNE